MRAWWLLLPIVVVLAICAWISGLNTTGDPSTTVMLWLATLTGATFLLISLLLAKRVRD